MKVLADEEEAAHARVERLRSHFKLEEERLWPAMKAGARLKDEAAV